MYSVSYKLDIAGQGSFPVTVFKTVVLNTVRTFFMEIVFGIVKL